MSTAPCYAHHKRFKRSTADWTANTTPVGEMDAGDGEILVLGNCLHGCGSTLARPTKAPAQR